MTDLDELTELLRSALTHLDDPSYLETHPLADRLSLVSAGPGLSRGQALRRVLRLAIEALDPGPDISPQAPEARPYQILSRHYIAKRSMTLVSTDLDVSERQAYRELRRATEALAQIVSGMLREPTPEATTPTSQDARATKVWQEIERLSSGEEQEVNLGQLLAEVVESARCLAQAKGLRLQMTGCVQDLYAVINRVMLRQAVLNLLSHVVRAHQGETLLLQLQRLEREVIFQLTYRPAVATEEIRPEEPYAVAAQLFATLGLNWSRQEDAAGRVQIKVHIPLAQEHSVLIVDDNEGLIALFKRYLRNQPYRVYAARRFDEALELIKTLQPEVVILDVMLPERDGWEVLQLMRQGPGYKPAVIVCSIINDPELSAALGANGFLHKPVDRGSLLQALRRALAGT
jgi:CheY-like chemotaxis protein